MTPGVTPLVAGNWKMNGTAASLDEIRDVCAGLDAESTLPHETLLCVPATLIERAAGVAAESALAIGAEDCHAKESGAHTGDISAEMIAMPARRRSLSAIPNAAPITLRPTRTCGTRPRRHGALV
jgi:triosephosphate isomerase